MTRTLIVLCVLAIALVAEAKVGSEIRRKMKQKANEKFDWNHETAGAIAPVLQPFGMGDIPAPRIQRSGGKNPGGHNFATRRAVDYAIQFAKTRGDGGAQQKKLENVLGFSAADLEKDVDQSFAVYSLVYGNFQNELRVNLDGEGGVGVAIAGNLIGARFGGDTEIAVKDSKGVAHSKWYMANNGETGYTSANPIHSMLQDTSDKQKNAQKYTQAHSLGLLKAFVTESLTEAIDLLQKDQAKKAQLAKDKKSWNPLVHLSNAVSNTVNAGYSYWNGDSGFHQGYAKALRLLGSIFHTIQDSACACTPKAQPATKDITTGWTGLEIGSGGSLGTKLGPCKPGDGHSVLEKQPDGSWKVTALADGVYYTARHAMHAKLDSMYEPGNVADIAAIVAANDNLVTINNLPGIYESFDPAIAAGKILIDVANAVVAGTAPATAANTIAAAHVFSRYKEPLNNAPSI